MKTLASILLMAFAAGAYAANAPSAEAPAVAGSSTHGTAQKPLFEWREWSDAVFAEAKAKHRYVLLDVAADWCHWCHVMDATTYRDPKVVALIKKHFIPVRVDQDAYPDLSRRYENFGWPATIVLNGDGQDIGKMRGYRESERFIKQLNAILKDPSPLFTGEDEDIGKVFSKKTRLSDATRKKITERYQGALDMKIGGMEQPQRFLVRDTLEYSMALATRGDKNAEKWVRLTLDNGRALIDPAWGGMYQYSTDSDWQHPHFEKIMETQANAIRLYSEAWRSLKEPGYIDAAQDVRRYIKSFLTSPDGAFYTTQDADLVPGEHSGEYFALDDAGRRARGIPRIDTHVYSRENGWMIEALAGLYSATGDSAVLDEAKTAARWIIAQRGNPDGSFRHDAVDKAGPYIGDTLAMARAQLALYTVTGEREWLQGARRAATAMKRFAAKNGGGYLPTPPAKGVKLAPRPHLDENIDMARFGNDLYRYTGDAGDKALGEVALRYISTDSVALRYWAVPGILLAAEEAVGDPLHMTVVGAKGDAQSQTLFKAALTQGGIYRRIEWWDTAEGKLLNPDVSYPPQTKPAAFICTNNTCSLPLFEAADIAKQLALLAAPAK